ncbi:MAG TPA: hypothetical protein VGU65_05715 [Frateuria sp.]|uniref:hypothetical protein n=1 Tax=Frateuria sp. TaxID=2211372 RepID=UPI002DE34BDE|nr:hypothetical protein [Frateuria sp.]
MSMFGQHARVRSAQRRMSEARRAVAVPASALLARGERHPLVVLGIAAGAGLVMGRMDVHPMRVPGMSGLIGGVMSELTALGAGFLAHATNEDA